MVEGDAHRAVERVARLSYGKLVALLAARGSGLAAAEDALADALARALERWPVDGLPDNPVGWIMTTARRRLIDGARRARTVDEGMNHVLLQEDERAHADAGKWPDERLKLLFACAHPAIGTADRAPLVMQVVLGLDARRIASAFLVAPAAMGQRLSRAKARIAATCIPFSIPHLDAWPERMGAVLDALYAAFTIGWDSAHGDDAKTSGLAEEAVWLASLVARLAPDEPEALGLLSLMLFSEARREARRDPATGTYVPLSEQDSASWNADMLDDAEIALRHAGSLGRPGRYQLEAAIQAIHAARRTSSRTEWVEIAALYEGLLRITPSLGAAVAAASATGEAFGHERALAALDAIRSDRVTSYQPWWAARAHALARLGRNEEARSAYAKAAGLTEDAATRRYLLSRSPLLLVS